MNEIDMTTGLLRPVVDLKRENKIPYITDIDNDKPVFKWGPNLPVDIKVRVKSHTTLKSNLEELTQEVTSLSDFIEVNSKFEELTKNQYEDLYVRYQVNSELDFLHKYRSTKGINQKLLLYKKAMKDYIIDNNHFNSFVEVLKAQHRLHLELLRSQLETARQNLELARSLNVFDGYCVSRQAAKDLGFVQFIDGIYYLEKNLTPNELKLNNGKKSISYRSIQLNYNANSQSSTFNAILSRYHDLRSFRNYTASSYQVARMLGNASVGIEIETSRGGIIEEDIAYYGVIPLKDSSVSGYEYATVPYGMRSEALNEVSKINMAKDLIILKDLCESLNKRCAIDNKCSLHVHFGNVRKDKLYIIALYILCKHLEEDLFSIQPYYKHDSKKYLGTAKNYCKKLPDIDFKSVFNSDDKTSFQDRVNKEYDKIFYILSDGFNMGTKYNRKNHVHPSGNKWNRSMRYSWVNIVNTVFNTEGTIEFRLHSATLNFQKIINWILICNAIIKYADTHTKEIINSELPISLITVLNGYENNFRDKKRSTKYGLFLYEYLLSYVNERRDYFKRLTAINKVDGMEDILNNDANYVFEYQGISTLY